MSKSYICPVCGCDGLEKAPYNEHDYGSFVDCSCCGFEFGVSEDNDVDLGYTVIPKEMREAAFQLYRKQWIGEGAFVANTEEYPKEYQDNGQVKREIIIKQLKRLNLPIEKFYFL
ncbi:hypothetical protein [Virgibacillus proomii]|uniref:hypothetical protein n=1 Tax=Virgibacillus proomii TaxID=84407 RepID=UPI000985F3F0|nr:hypothetical protein [Virgibacillus proomii]